MNPYIRLVLFALFVSCVSGVQPAFAQLIHEYIYMDEDNERRGDIRQRSRVHADNIIGKCSIIGRLNEARADISELLTTVQNELNACRQGGTCSVATQQRYVEERNRLQASLSVRELELEFRNAERVGFNVTIGPRSPLFWFLYPQSHTADFKNIDDLRSGLNGVRIDEIHSGALVALSNLHQERPIRGNTIADDLRVGIGNDERAVFSLRKVDKVGFELQLSGGGPVEQYCGHYLDREGDLLSLSVNLMDDQYFSGPIVVRYHVRLSRTGEEAENIFLRNVVEQRLEDFITPILGPEALIPLDREVTDSVFDRRDVDSVCLDRAARAVAQMRRATLPIRSQYGLGDFVPRILSEAEIESPLCDYCGLDTGEVSALAIPIPGDDGSKGTVIVSNGSLRSIMLLGWDRTKLWDLGVCR